MAKICANTVTRNLKQTPRLISASTLRYSTQRDSSKPDGWESAMPYDSIPGPKPLPIIGNKWRFLPIIGTFSNSTYVNLQPVLYKKYGKIVRLASIPKDLVYVFNPEDIENVHRNEGIYPSRDTAGQTHAYYRNHIRSDVFQGVGGVLTVDGAAWQSLRTKVNPILMNLQNMLQYIGAIDSITNDLLAKIRHLAKLDSKREVPGEFHHTLYTWTLESVVFIGLDRRFGCLDFNLDKNSEQVKLLQHTLNISNSFAILELLPTFREIHKTEIWKRYVESADFVTFTFLKYIQDVEAQRKDSDKEGTSVLEQLLKIDKKVAVAMALDMLIAGVDSTGKQVATILYYLAKNPTAQERLRKELVTLLPTKESPVTKDVLANASYLKAVIKETERIAPITTGNIRKSAQEMILSGYRIPKGTNVITCNNHASLLPENYPRPLEFLPDRWLRTTKGELSHKNTNLFVTQPFGYGPRSCVGRRIAKLEMEVGLAKIMRNFRVNWNYKDPTFGGNLFRAIISPLKLQFIELDQ